jgi:tetratricopeptide (TPR) repeat protein
VKNHRFSLVANGIKKCSRYEKTAGLTDDANQKAVDPFIEITQFTWDNFASAGNWTSAASIGQISAKKRPHLYYGWENWSWALHKQGLSQEAYNLLAPILKNLKPKGPPSGRAAWCLACFCSCLGRSKEAKRWLRLAGTLAQDKSVFHFHTVREPDLQAIWRELEELV